MDMIFKDRLRQLQMHLVGIADINPAAPALERARSFGIFTTQDYHDLFDIPGLDLLIELSGRAEVSQAIQKEKPVHVQLMDHTVARLFWDLIRLEDEKLATEKKAEKRVEKERDKTAEILNNLIDSVIVMNKGFVIENVNQTFLKEFSLERDEVIGRPCFQAIFKRQEPCEASFCPISRVSKEGPQRRQKEYVVPRQGRMVYYEAHFRPLKDQDNLDTRWLISLREITDRKRLELDLEESQKKYKDLFDNAREGLLLFDPHGKILEANISFAYMLGYLKGEIEGMGISDLAKGPSKKILRDYLDDLKTLGFTAVTMDFVRKNGDTLPIEANVTWLPEEGLFRFMARDITLEKRLEESRRVYSERLEKDVEERTRELKASEEEASRQKKTAEGIIYGSPIPMFVLDKNHRVFYWNKACEKLTGYSSQEMIGTDQHWKPFYPNKRPLLADLVMDDDPETIQRLYKDMNLRRSPMVEGAYEAEHFFSHLGPEGTHLYFNAAPIKDDSGNIQGAIVTYQDFSERVRMTQQIKRREAFVQNLIQNSIDGIIATEARGKIVIFNRGATQILGYTPEELIGRMSYQEILPDETAVAIREAFSGTRYGPPGKIINMETKLLNKAAETIPVRLSATLLFERKKEVGAVLFIQDLREIRRLQKEKGKAERMAAVGRTVAGLAHYIKNILTGLKGGAYVINSAMSKRDLELARKGWEMVEKNIDQISNIVTDMLIYSHERKPQYEWVNPNTLLEEVMELMEEKARTSGVMVVRDLQPDLEVVAMDRTAIHRCLLNLISNAIDACTLEAIMEGNGVITVKTDRPHGWGVRFQVSDNGTGMNQETQKRLFTDFFTTKGYKGTGLGLPVTQRIVKEHGGELTFESRTGEGTTFNLMLPERRNH